MHYRERIEALLTPARRPFRRSGLLDVGEDADTALAAAHEQIAALTAERDRLAEALEALLSPDEENEGA